MPIALNRLTATPFPIGEYLYTAGEKSRIEQQGWRSRPSEDKSQVLPYYSFRHTGNITRLRPYPGMPNNAWYSPNPTTSDVPYVPYSVWKGDQVTSAIRNKAYAKFKDVAVGESSQMGTFIAEGREAYGMIANRATGLYRSYRELKRGNFRGFLRELSVKPKRKHRNVVRTAAGEASGLWLEYWFGWSPSISDMFTAYSILTASPKGGRRHFGSSGSRLPHAARESGTSTTRREVTGQGFRMCKTGATVKLVNYNAAVRASLGLSNPLTIAWELVPFSFVVDWFTQYGNTLEAMTDFAGFELMDPYTTIFQRVDVTHESWSRSYGGRGYNSVANFRVFQMERKKGLVSPTVLRPRITNFGSSVTRAATAVSLLTAIFLDR